MSKSAHRERQRDFYDSGSHGHLQAREDDFYSRKLAARVADQLRLAPSDELLEVGAGFGRFTFHVLEHCGQVLALDLTQRGLDQLGRERDRRGIGADRCATMQSDVDAFARNDERCFDAIIGFFFLHHLPDPEASIAALAKRLRPNAPMAFVEPNRWNPLFAVQLTACSDMNWRDEIGVYKITPNRIARAFRAAGLEQVESEAFGFFPPQIHNRSEAARRFESRCESRRWLRGILPFHLVSARAPEGDPS